MTGSACPRGPPNRRSPAAWARRDWHHPNKFDLGRLCPPYVCCGSPSAFPAHARAKHLDAGACGLIEDVGLEYRNPARFDAIVLEALGDDFVDDRLEQIGMRQRRKCLQEI